MEKDIFDFQSEEEQAKRLKKASGITGVDMDVYMALLRESLAMRASSDLPEKKKSTR